MSEQYVFDTEAIIAYLYNEPGHQTVGKLLEEVFQGEATGFLTEANASEVYYLVARFEGINDKPTEDSLRNADRDLRTLERNGVDIVAAQWRRAAEIKADGGISLADAYAVGFAYDNEATLIAGGDDDFDSLPVDVDLIRFRNHGV